MMHLFNFHGTKKKKLSPKMFSYMHTRHFFMRCMKSFYLCYCLFTFFPMRSLLHQGNQCQRQCSQAEGQTWIKQLITWSKQTMPSSSHGNKSQLRMRRFKCTENFTILFMIYYHFHRLSPKTLGKNKFINNLTANKTNLLNANLKVWIKINALRWVTYMNVHVCSLWMYFSVLLRFIN